MRTSCTNGAVASAPFHRARDVCQIPLVERELLEQVDAKLSVARERGAPTLDGTTSTGSFSAMIDAGR